MSTLGFIGFGNMIQAIWQGGLQSGAFSAENTKVCIRNPDTYADLFKKNKLRAANLNDTIQSDILVIGIKPQQFNDFAKQCTHHSFSHTLVVSIMAGISLKQLETVFGSETACVRVMPNTPIALGHGVCGISFNNNVSYAQKKTALTLFSHSAYCYECPEAYLDALTGLSGSGPAFVYAIADALAKAANPIPYPDALKLIAHTLQGAAAMLLNNPNTEELINQVRSPNGTTHAGLQRFELLHIDQALQNMLQAAIQRSKELSNPL